MSVAFRTGADGRLIAFVGRDCRGITLDGVQYVFGEKPFDQVVFAPEAEDSPVYRICVSGQGRIALPGSGDGEKSDRTAREKNGAVRNRPTGN